MDLWQKAKELFPGASDEDLNNGISQIQSEHPEATDDDLLDAVSQVKDAHEQGTLGKDLVNNSLKQKYNIGAPAPVDERQTLVDKLNSQDDSPIAATLAGFGAGLRGGDVTSTFNRVNNADKIAAKNQLDLYDANAEKAKMARNDQQSQQKLANEADPNSPESKIAQDLAISLGMRPDQARLLTAAKFKEFSPALQKKYEIEQSKLARKDKLQERQDQMNLARQDKLEKQDQKGTVAQQAVDKNFGEDYQKYIAQGGYTEAKNQIEQIDEVKKALEKDDSLTGPIKGSLGDDVNAFLNPKSIAVRDKLRGAISGSLKQILGPAFTEKEGERVFANAYNPKLSVKDNIAKVNATLDKLRGMAQAKQAAVEYYENNGSLKGFKAADKLQMVNNDSPPNPDEIVTVIQDGEPVKVRRGDLPKMTARN